MKKILQHLREPFRTKRKAFLSTTEKHWMERVEIKLFGITIITENHFIQL